jgi:hypothetical protein
VIGDAPKQPHVQKESKHHLTVTVPTHIGSCRKR